MLCIYCTTCNFPFPYVNNFSSGSSVLIITSKEKLRYACVLTLKSRDIVSNEDLLLCVDPLPVFLVNIHS